MIKFFNDNIKAYEKFAEQAKPYSISFNFVNFTFLLTIIFYCLNYFNPQTIFFNIFKISSWVSCLFCSALIIVFFVKEEKRVEMSANFYIKNNMKVSPFRIKYPYIEGLFNINDILMVINIAIFYASSFYFLFNPSEKPLPSGGGCKLFNNIEISQLVS